MQQMSLQTSFNKMKVRNYFKKINTGGILFINNKANFYQRKGVNRESLLINGLKAQVLLHTVL